MPCFKCSNDKWKIGSGKCMYPSKTVCERALKGYQASKHMHHSVDDGKFLENRKRKFNV